MVIPVRTANRSYLPNSNFLHLTYKRLRFDPVAKRTLRYIFDILNFKGMSASEPSSMILDILQKSSMRNVQPLGRKRPLSGIAQRIYAKKRMKYSIDAYRWI